MLPADSILYKQIVLSITAAHRLQKDVTNSVINFDKNPKVGINRKTHLHADGSIY